MNNYQILTRINHFFTAKHYHGHGIHSPFLYDFIRQTMKLSYNDILKLKNAHIVHNTNELKEIDNYHILIFIEPFVSKIEKEKFRAWFDHNFYAALYFQGMIVIFNNPNLQKQFFKVRK